VNRIIKLLLLAAALAVLAVVPAQASKTLYADTLSLWGRTSDSTSVQSVSGRTTVALAFKVAGVVTAGIQRYAVSVRWYYGVAADDSTTRVTAMPFPLLKPANKTVGAVTLDSLCQKDDASATLPGSQYEMLIGLIGGLTTVRHQAGPWTPVTIEVPERVIGYSIKFRLISQSTAKPTGAAGAAPGYQLLTIVRL